MGRGDNRLTPKMKRARGQAAKKARLKRRAEEAAAAKTGRKKKRTKK